MFSVLDNSTMLHEQWQNLPYPCSGGHRGFSQAIWTVKEFVGGGASPYITLYYHSFDGEQGNTETLHTLSVQKQNTSFSEPSFI